MNKTQLQRIQLLTGAPAEVQSMTLSDWERIGGSKHPVLGDCIELRQESLLVVRVSAAELQVLRIHSALTPLEQELLKWAIQPSQQRPQGGSSDSERQARRLGEWIDQSLSLGEMRAEVPERFELGGRLFDGMIPFLLHSEQQAEEREPSYAELEKVLRSFISDEMMLIPIREREWLVLGSDRLLAEVEGAEEDIVDHDVTKEALHSLATGLHQMVTEEWGGECHVAVDLPMIPSESLVQTVATLRDTMYLGRKFHAGLHVHLPWMVHLERLLSGIPEGTRLRFMEEMAARPDLFTEPETISTLDAFFAMDCNVSETAKKLFIHRNTLLYRLDKLKQETGLDVRSFNDAVLVRIMLLLYKVTKRK
ncbi:helix-turn-helix domain-containing protein [Cohnella lubricantis]|uniref:Helix-turn-helix domain-containing protein n=1 Tax=Cohnella lubricantis TaxID=2163172 RepID=A0A841TD24_9BACL|nr:helix-turn-helix domain-containing protein [Cohnella lubricantis]MBB6679363.1 helix-turn-helix domain-containing protein [Cohnella lubricantis]MBP2120154.1 carbohydrate diacid regulator [Cohnella lubricantis]